MNKHNKNFYSLEELKRARDCYDSYQDGEEVYYFVGALRYACDEIERLNKIIEIKTNRIQQLMKRTRSARINKAIEYIERDLSNLNIQENIVAKNELLQIKKILKGEDK